MTNMKSKMPDVCISSYAFNFRSFVSRRRTLPRYLFSGCLF